MNGRDGLRSMCNIKAVIDDRFPLHQANRIYPVSERDYGRFGGVIDLLYGRGLAQKWRGLTRLVTRK
jgi:hypothetical protein